MQQLFSETLEREYDSEKYTKFIVELLNDPEIGSTRLDVSRPFNDHIDEFHYIGRYEDKDDKKLHILEVKLKNGRKLDAARTMQRNLIARYIKEHWLDAALVSFWAEDSTSWRLSFVKVDYKFDEKGKTREELTPAKRFSYLVGRGEPSHTARQQLLKIFELVIENPTLSDIEKAFSVEKVTKEFFGEYRSLFESLVDELKRNHTFNNVAITNRIDTENFAKKLLGQIVFLYFLQKKGWLGVPKGKSWGDGDKFFMRTLFDDCMKKDKNYYTDYLEVLFYDTLNNPRSEKVDRNYSDYFKTKIPFLNGGLFEAQYEWQTNFIYLDNNVFKEILDVFDLYNFTVKEDEPLEKDVAVDPEMLGKVFENLLEENLRKGKGTYYTPREIVHYMCQESLISHLVSNTEMEEEIIREFIKKSINNGEGLPGEIEHEKHQFLESLRNIKVVDPACGSGAFLVGMLQEVVRARLSLESEHNDYIVKKETIQNSIYGVDIDPGAVEIAKLRLWLTLVVDYDLEEVEPLPNLDYKIMQGNSLLEGLILGDTSIRLFDWKLVSSDSRSSNRFETGSQVGMFDGETREELSRMIKLQHKYFETSDIEKKKNLKQDIDSIENNIIERSIKDEIKNIQGQRVNVKSFPGIGLIPEQVEKLEKISSREAQVLRVWNELNRSGIKPFFLWHLHFSNVFRQKGGFDIVIANPPYGIVYDELLKKTYKRLFDEFRRNNDIYVAFIVFGISLLNDNGVICYITPNTYLIGDYYLKLRKLIASQLNLYRIIDYKNSRVFDDPTVFVSVLIGQKDNKGTAQMVLEVVKDDKEKGNDLYIVNLKGDTENLFIKPPNTIIDKIYSQKGIKTFDDLFYVKDVGFNYWTKGRGKKRGGNSIGKRVFYSGNKKDPNDIPFLKGRDIYRYFINENQSNYLRHDYEKHLNPEVDTMRFSEDYLKKIPKIIYRQTSSEIIAAIDRRGRYLDKTVHLIVPKTDREIFDLRFVVGLLNSELFQYIYNQISQERSGRTFAQVKTTYVKKFPFPIIDAGKQKVLIDLVEEIEKRRMRTAIAENRRLFEKVDKCVYELFNITKEEKKIIKVGLGETESK